MAGVNKVILLGNLGSDPQIRHLEGGVARANFSLATTEAYKDKTGKRIEQTEWHNIVLWRGLADLAEKYLKKGMTIYLEGKIQSRNWQDKEGMTRNITEINVETFKILSKKEPEQEKKNSGNNFSPSDDLPF